MKKKWNMIKDIVEKHTLKKPIYVGDTIGDKNAADSAGIDFIHAAWGYNNIDDKCLSFKSFTELIDYFID
jgi:phosphoglycolate phosphatase